MTRRPLVVTRDAAPGDLARLVETARVRHLPLMDGDQLAGLWIATEDGPLVLLGPDSVHTAGPDDDAEEAVAALLKDREAAVVMEDGRAVGMLTRADVLGIVRAALARGVDRPADRPLVVLLVGPAGAGKSTLLMRTIPLLRDCEAGVVRADAAPDTPPTTQTIAGATAITDPRAHWRAGLRDAVRALGDVQLVLVEDRDREPEARGGPGGDLQVLVVPAADGHLLSGDAVREAQAVVLTKLDAAPAGAAERSRAHLGACCPDVPVFGVAAESDDTGLAEWRDWLLGRVLPRGHR